MKRPRGQGRFNILESYIMGDGAEGKRDLDVELTGGSALSRSVQRLKGARLSAGLESIATTLAAGLAMGC